MRIKNKIVSSILFGIAAIFICTDVLAQDSPLDTSAIKQSYMSEYPINYYYNYHPPSMLVCSGCYQVDTRISRGEIVDLCVNHCILSQWRRIFFDEGDIISVCDQNGNCIEDYLVQEDNERYYYYIWNENYNYCD
jgi:hypothetical protein